MKTNKQMTEEISEMLTDLQNNRFGMYRTGIPEDEIQNALKCVHAIVNRLCSDLREKHKEKMVLDSELEKEYLESE